MSLPPLPPPSASPLPATELVPWLDGTGRYGYSDRAGKLRIPARFKAARLFYDGLAAVYDGDRWGFIDAQGQWRIRPQYQAVRDFQQGKTLAYRFKSPWLGPIMHLVLKSGEQSELEIDRDGRELSRIDSPANVLPETVSWDNPFWPRYREPARPLDDPGEIGGSKFSLVRTIVDVDGSGVKFVAGRGADGAWTIFSPAHKPIAQMFEVAPWASEGGFVAMPPNAGYDAFDETGRQITRVQAAFAFAFRNGVAETYVPDVGPVFVDRQGKTFADQAYIDARHRAVGR
jgi:hypothetical protein